MTNRVYDGWRLVAAKDKDGQWWSLECQRCGKCCEDRKGQGFPRCGESYIGEDGVCKHLSYENKVAKCELLNDRPQSCSFEVPMKQPDYCKSIHRKIDDPVSLL